MPNGRAATADELRSICDAYVKAALLAKALGADGVEIHAAHGYFLDQFLWHETNRRTDEYGGEGLQERVCYPAAIVRAIREAAGEEFLIGLRFSVERSGLRGASGRHFKHCA
jgi:2,4-dienoyl-CoA reductase-like NADH-dependent reductase (Old Yellow Enzyme family)